MAQHAWGVGGSSPFSVSGCFRMPIAFILLYILESINIIEECYEKYPKLLPKNITKKINKDLYSRIQNFSSFKKFIESLGTTEIANYNNVFKKKYPSSDIKKYLGWTTFANVKTRVSAVSFVINSFVKSNANAKTIKNKCSLWTVNTSNDNTKTYVPNIKNIYIEHGYSEFITKNGTTYGAGEGQTVYCSWAHIKSTSGNTGRYVRIDKI